MSLRRSSRLPYILAFLAISSILFQTGCRKTLPEKIQSILNNQSCQYLKIGLVSYPRELNPILPLDESARFVCNMIHRAPLKRMPDGSYAPDLWSEWKTSVDAEGNLVIEATWKEQLVWHDGVPFSLRDFLFTMEAMKNPENRSPFGLLANRVQQIESLNEGKGCRIVCKGNSVQVLEILAAGLLPAHLFGNQKLAEATLSIASETEAISFGVATGQIRFSDAPIGLGPYKLIGTTGRSFLHFEAWPGTASDTAAPVSSPEGIRPQKVMIRFYYRPEDLLDDLRNGKIDWANVPSEYAVKFEEMKVPGTTFVRFPNPSYLMLGFNVRREPFNNRDLRKAINQLIDRKKLKEIIPYDGVIPDGPPGLTGSTTPNPVSPEAISTLLDSAGLKDTNADGLREFQGKPFSFEILTNQDNLLRKLIAESITADLKRAGIQASVRVLSWAEIVNDRLAHGKFETFLLGFQAPANGNWHDIWHTASASDAASLTGNYNFTGFSHAELDRALEALNGFPQPPDPLPIRQKIREILQDETPGCFLFQPYDVAIVSDRVSGWEKTGEIWEQQIDLWKKKEAIHPGVKP